MTSFDSFMKQVAKAVFVNPRDDRWGEFGHLVDIAAERGYLVWSRDRMVFEITKKGWEYAQDIDLGADFADDVRHEAHSLFEFLCKVEHYGVVSGANDHFSQYEYDTFGQEAHDKGFIRWNNERRGYILTDQGYAFVRDYDSGKSLGDVLASALDRKAEAKQPNPPPVPVNPYQNNKSYGLI